MRAGALHLTLVVAAMLALPAAAAAQQPGLPVVPISGDPLAGDVEEFTGHAAAPSPVKTPRVPRHPFMAPNGRSNLHNDAYMTDVYRRLEGPLGRGTSTGSALFARECGSVTFDTRGRIETICVGVDRPVLALLDPTSLEVRAKLDLPPREVGGGDIFTNFSGGGYFYLDDRDRAVVPTTTRHVLVVGQTATPGFAVRRDYDLSRAVPAGDELISVLPDWDGRIWFASRQGGVGWISPESGRIASRALGEQIGNSFAVDDTGGVYIVTDAALYRFEARGGEVRAVWRRPYENIGRRKPGQTQAGSGTTPTLMGRRYVAITDNADPMNVLILRRGRHARGKIVCREPVFAPGAGATDQSLIGTGRSVVVENNYGYTGPASVTGDATTTPGLERVKLDRDGRGCRTVWHSDEVAPSVVPKLAAGSGLVFTYTKPPSANGAWYATAIDYRSGETVYRRLAGAGLGFNNNFAPVTIGPDDIAYVGVLGGITRFAD
jgi:hypothetical protein